LFYMAKSHLKLVAPTEVNRTVAPTRRPNAELRTREHLTPGEVDTLIEAAKANRHGHRDATMILLAFRHGLRAAEACDLRWDQVEFDAAVLHVRRVKNGTPSTHPLIGDEMRALRGSSVRASCRPSYSSASGDPRSRQPASPG
jgi:integrase